ncbi:MAG TPA: hypothetical protein VKR06_24860 [Ktedonosporobacter sp.]|nr:hypothetical protein [Ktedonosporobacter sp.]
MKAYPYNRSFDQQYFSKSVIIKVSVIVALAMVLLAATLSMNVSKAQAHTTSAQTSATQLSKNQAALPASYISMIYQVFGPVYGPGAVHVAMCESSLNPQAWNPQPILGGHAMGLFQVLYPSTWVTTGEAGSSPYNAAANIQAAHQIFLRDGYSWREWVCQP